MGVVDVARPLPLAAWRTGRRPASGRGPGGRRRNAWTPATWCSFRAACCSHATAASRSSALLRFIVSVNPCAGGFLFGCSHNSSGDTEQDDSASHPLMTVSTQDSTADIAQTSGQHLKLTVLSETGKHIDGPQAAACSPPEL